jgi:hypothetical protein
MSLTVGNLRRQKVKSLEEKNIANISNALGDVLATKHFVARTPRDGITLEEYLKREERWTLESTKAFGNVIQALELLITKRCNVVYDVDRLVPSNVIVTEYPVLYMRLSCCDVIQSTSVQINSFTEYSYILNVVSQLRKRFLEPYGLSLSGSPIDDSRTFESLKKDWSDVFPAHSAAQAARAAALSARADARAARLESLREA